MAATPKFPSLPVERLLIAPHTVASGVPEGLDALLLGELASRTPNGAPILHIARDANRPHSGLSLVEVTRLVFM